MGKSSSVFPESRIPAAFAGLARPGTPWGSATQRYWSVGAGPASFGEALAEAVGGVGSASLGVARGVDLPPQAANSMFVIKSDDTIRQVRLRMAAALRWGFGTRVGAHEEQTTEPAKTFTRLAERSWSPTSLALRREDLCGSQGGPKGVAHPADDEDPSIAQERGRVPESGHRHRDGGGPRI